MKEGISEEFGVNPEGAVAQIEKTPSARFLGRLEMTIP